MKKLFLFFLLAAVTACLTACSKDEDEAKAKCLVSVNVYESLMPKGDADYKPKAFTYYKVMLFSVAASEIDKNSTEVLENNSVLLTNGKTLQASYVSDTGRITADHGEYTLLVYLTGNPFNAYLEHRFMYKSVKLNASTMEDSCCFVWDDMNTKGCFYPWTVK